MSREDGGYYQRHIIGVLFTTAANELGEGGGCGWGKSPCDSQHWPTESTVLQYPRMLEYCYMSARLATLKG